MVWRKLKWIDGVLIVGVGLIVIGVGLSWKDKLTKSDKAEVVKVVTPTVVQSNNNVIFDIEGEVMRPGVYKLAKGSRISDALAAAGGLAAQADREWVKMNINRAEVLADGMKIFIPKLNEQITRNNQQLRPDSEILGVQKSGIININTAGVEELDKLVGIGPAMAGRIIEYREKNGGFKDINEIKLVSGIGDKLFEKIKDKISI